jgi:hypothetical protein
MERLLILLLPLLGMLRFAPPIRPGSSAEAGPASGDGFLLENGTDFYLMESGDFLLLE